MKHETSPITEIVDVTTIRALNDRFRHSLRGGIWH